MVHIDFPPFKPLFPFKWVGNFYFTFLITLSFKMDGHFPQRMLNIRPPWFVSVIVSHLDGYMVFTLIVMQHYLLSHKKNVMFIMVLLGIFKL
jgi:hypothetical protein